MEGNQLNSTQYARLVAWMAHTLSCAWVPYEPSEDTPMPTKAPCGSAWTPKAKHMDLLVPTKATKESEASTGFLLGVWKEFKKNLSRIPPVLGGCRHE